jgi:peptidyl-prolyl cis-trans isomerase D
MLNGLRKAGNSLVGRIVATILFGILIASFAIWGIGDIFRTTPQGAVATVGKTEISLDQFRTAYNNEIQRLNRQFRTTITPEQARTFGIDQRVLARLVSEAVLSERARGLGLSVSDQLVARSILDEPSLRGPNGQFDRSRFEELLRSNGLTEAGFVRDQRFALVRVHLADALAGALPVPLAAREAFHRYQNERRAAAYLMLGPAAAGEVPAPTDAELQSFFNDRKASFSAPEYRALNVLVLNAGSLAKPGAVSDDDARKAYEQNRASYGTPERRTVQQIAFPSPGEAEGAFERIKNGTTFEAVAGERNIPEGDLDLGTFTKAEMLDPAVADAAFALQEGAVSGPVQGRFGTVLVRVTRIEPEAVRPYEAVATDVKRQIAQERARDEIETTHDAIEDMRASAKPLADVAKEKGLALIQVPTVDQNGNDKAGNPIENLPERNALLAAAFASDIGVDNEALRARDGGYVWFDVTGIEPSRERPLQEVRDAVARQWRDDQVAQRLSEKARQLVERLDKGEAIETIAAEAGSEAKTTSDLARRTPKDDLTTEVVNRVFTTPVGRAGSATNAPETRAVFKVTSATVPPFASTTQEAQRIEDQLRNAMSDDIIAQYIAEVQKEIGVVVNPQAVRQVIGGDV